MKTDFEIQNDVIEQLAWNPFLNPDEIKVAVEDGIVKLSGTVDVYAQRLSAERAAKRVADVKGIADDIKIMVD